MSVREDMSVFDPFYMIEVSASQPEMKGTSGSMKKKKKKLCLLS